MTLQGAQKRIKENREGTVNTFDIVKSLTEIKEMLLEVKNYCNFFLMEYPTVDEITGCIEAFAPLHLQESYDNSGLQVGSRTMAVCSVLLTVDVTREVIEEAIAKKASMVISHHPLIFTGLKRIVGNSEIEDIVRLAIKHDIAIYASHTNLDSAPGGVSHKMAEKLGLINLSVLDPVSANLCKLVVFVPIAFVEKVRLAMFEAGAGTVGNYDSCSYGSRGEGTFRAGENANPFVGEVGQRHVEPEIRLEMICPIAISKVVIAAMLAAHPYERWLTMYMLWITSILRLAWVWWAIYPMPCQR